jgi:hypothetical protein
LEEKEFIDKERRKWRGFNPLSSQIAQTLKHSHPTTESRGKPLKEILRGKLKKGRV